MKNATLSNNNFSIGAREGSFVTIVGDYTDDDPRYLPQGPGLFDPDYRSMIQIEPQP